MISTNHCQIKNLSLSLSHDIHLQIPHRRQLPQHSQAPHRSRPVTPPRPKPIPELPEYLVHVVPRPQHHSVAEIPHPQPQHLSQLQLPLPLQLTPDFLRIQHHLACTPSTPAAHQKHLPIFPPHPLPIPTPINALQPLARQSIPPNCLRVPAPPVLLGILHQPPSHTIQVHVRRHSLHRAGLILSLYFRCPSRRGGRAARRGAGGCCGR